MKGNVPLFRAAQVYTSGNLGFSLSSVSEQKTWPQGNHLTAWAPLSSFKYTKRFALGYLHHFLDLCTVYKLMLKIVSILFTSFLLYISSHWFYLCHFSGKLARRKKQPSHHQLRYFIHINPEEQFHLLKYRFKNNFSFKLK